MTSIEFYTGIADPIAATHRLARKVYASGHRLRIATPDEATTALLDRALWETPEDAFVPHCALASPLREATPIIVDHSNDHDGPADVLISLCAQPPKYFARFERVFEVVGVDTALATAGRERWAFYKSRGYPLKHTDLSKRA